MTHGQHGDFIIELDKAFDDIDYFMEKDEQAKQDQMYEEEAAKNPKFAKIYTEWKKFRGEEAAWFALAESAMDEFLSSKL